jgi:speckle-type POZ protein
VITMEAGKRPPVPCSGWCYSEVEADTAYDYAWTIERFSRIAASFRPGKTMYSGQFVVMVHGRETRWRLKMYPNGRKQVDAGYVTLFLKDSGRVSPANVRANIKFSVVTSSGDSVNSKVIDKEYKVFNHAFGYSKFAKHSMLLTPELGLLPEDRLTLLCNITIMSVKCVVSSGRQWPPLAAPAPALPQSSTLGTQLVQLLSSPEELFSDLVLEVGQPTEGRTVEELACHRNILSARSPVFRAMFQHDMTEARSKRVRIPDMEPVVGRQMLQYMYTGSLEELGQCGKSELLAAADKYCLLELKKYCEAELCREVQVTTALKLLVIADRHDAAELKSTCVKVILERSQEVVKQTGWREILQPYPRLLADMFEVLASSPLAKRRRVE